MVKLQNQATAALTPAYNELAAQLPTEPVLGIDESPTKEARIKSWLWTFVAGTYTVFALRTTRAATVLTELLTGDFTGVVNCDRAKMYWNVGRPQWCWAHLKRDFQALIDHPDHQVKRLGHDLMRRTKDLFRHWSRCRDGTITRTDVLDELIRRYAIDNSWHAVEADWQAGRIGSRNHAVYCATKFALAGFSESLVYELAGTGVGVTLVNPGIIATSFFDHASFAQFPARARRRAIAPEVVATAILRALRRGDAEVTVPAHFALGTILKTLAPGMFRRLMRRQA